MGAHVLFNLLNELRENGKIRGCAKHIILLSLNELNQFNENRAQMQGSVCYNTLNWRVIGDIAVFVTVSEAMS